MKFIRLYLTVIFLALAPIALAQSLSGQLMDEQKKPLPYVTVLLKPTGGGRLTDAEGNFKWQALPAGQYLLEARMIGFDTLRKTVTITSGGSLIDLGTLIMKPTVKMLNAVVVSASRPVIERHADKLIVNLNDALAGGNSMMELLDKLPGVQVNPNDQISLNARPVQIYIDGKATPLSSEALAGLLKGMPAGSIQKVELIAHPSSRYDAAGGGGIINIVRKRNHKDGLNGSIYGGIGQGHFGKQNGGLNLNFKNTGYNLFFNMDYNNNHYLVDNDISTRYNGNLSRSLLTSDRNTRIYTPTLGLDLYLSKKTTLSLSLTDGIQRLDKDAQTVTTNTAAAGSTFINQVKTNAGNVSPGIHLQHQLDSSGRELTVDADYYHYSNQALQHNQLNHVPSQFDLDRNFGIYSLKADYTQPLAGGGSLEAGVKSSYVHSNNSNIYYDIIGGQPLQDHAQDDLFTYQEQINAAYVNLNRTGKKLSYQVGLRTENTNGKAEQTITGQTFDKTYVQLFPSGYVDYRLTEKNNLNFSLNRNVNRPSYENLNPLIRVVNANTYQQGNPDLRPALAYNSSLTYSWNNAFYANLNYGLTFHDLTYYTLPYNSSSTINTTKPVNNRYSEYYSLILSYNKQVSPLWFTSTNVNFNRQAFRSTDENGGLYNAGLAAINFDSYDSFNITKRLTVLGLLRIRSRSAAANMITQPYWTLTAGIRQQVLGTRGSISCNVTDIFNTFKNDYQQSSVLISQIWRNHYESRVIRISFNYSFGGKLTKNKTSYGAAAEKQRTDAKEN